MDWRGVRGRLISAAARINRVPGWVRTATGIAILAIVLGFFAKRADQVLEMVRAAWQPVGWLYLVLSFLLLMVCLLLQALLWYGILRICGGQIPLPTALRIYSFTLLPRYVPGMVWGYAGRALLCEREGIARKVAMVSIVGEMGLLAASGLVVVLLGYLASGWFAAVTVLAPILLLGALLAHPKSRLGSGHALRRAALWYGWGLAYIFFWLLYGASSWLAAMSVVPDAALNDAMGIIVSSIAAWLAGFLVVFVPSGLGIREGVFALSLTPIVGSSGAVLIPLLARLNSMLAELGFVVVSFLWLRDRGGKRAHWSRKDLPD